MLIQSIALFLGLMVLLSLFMVSRVNSVENNAPLIHKIENLPYKKVGLVFGAGYSGGKVSGILADRLDTAIQAYAQKKFSKFLVSGDNSSQYHNEVVVMQKYLMEKGIPQEDIVLDYAWFDTYDSLYRARDVFSVHSAILFTQAYHLPRALYIAQKLGLDTVGYAADKHTYTGMWFLEFREFFAKIKAFLETEIFHSLPHFLGPKLPIL